MPYRFSHGLKLARYSVNKVPLRYLKPNSVLLDAWEDFVVPEIVKDSCRADRTWNWRTLLLRESLIAKALNQSPEALVISVENGKNSVAPVGMMLLVKKFRSLSGKGSCVFIWYLSSAPNSAINNMLPLSHRPKGIGRLMIDTAITISINCNYNGRIALHAAKTLDGCNELLIPWYSSLGLNHLPKSNPISFTRKNDGRYFFTDKAAALSISQSFDAYR